MFFFTDWGKTFFDYLEGNEANGIIIDGKHFLTLKPDLQKKAKYFELIALQL